MPSSDMVNFMVVKYTGEILTVGRCEATMLDYQDTSGGVLIVTAVRVPDPRDYYWTGIGFAPYPPRPGLWASWNGTAWVDERTPEQKAAALETQLGKVRAERDRLLAESDWTDLPNAELDEAEKAAWLEYRRALRRITDDLSDPYNPVWPTPPG